MNKSRLWLLLLVYAVILLWEAWWPFNFQFRPSPGDPSVARVELLPFGSLVHRGIDLETYARKLVAFIPVGALLVGIWIGRRAAGTVLWRTLFLGASLSLLIQLGRYFLPRHLASSGDVIVNTFGALIGAAPVCFVHLSRRSLGILTAACAACFLLAATWPWHFSLHAASLESLAQRVEWSLFHGTFSLRTLRERALNALMTLPLGLLCAAYVLRGGSGRRAVQAAAWLGLCCSVSVESLQCFLPHRQPSLPDIFLNTLGALTGGAVALFLDRRQDRAPGVRFPDVPPATSA